MKRAYALLTKAVAGCRQVQAYQLDQSGNTARLVPQEDTANIQWSSRDWNIVSSLFKEADQNLLCVCIGTALPPPSLERLAFCSSVPLDVTFADAVIVGA